MGDQSYTLVRVDPRTLLPLPRSALSVKSVGSWSFSPDRSRLVVATVGPPSRCPQWSLRFFDARRMRPSGRLAIWRGGGVEVLSWLRADRLLAVRTTCEEQQKSSFVVINPIARRVVSSEPIEGELVRLVPTVGRFVALVAPRGPIASSRVVVVDANGVMRGRMLGRITAGAQRGANGVGRYAWPALAVGGERAFVVSRGDLVAEVELASLAVTYHRLVQRAVSAAAKASEGWSRRAVWLGNGLLAFSGSDAEVWTSAEGVGHLRDRPAGISVVDTNSWSVRVLDPDGDFFKRVGQLLYVTRYSWDSSTQTITGMGVAAYDFGGVKRFHIAPKTVAYLALVYRNEAYVGFDFRRGPYLIVDVDSGHVVGRRTARLPRLLREQASPFSGNGL